MWISHLLILQELLPSIQTKTITNVRSGETIFILYCMAMRGIPEYIAIARTILHASVGQVHYGPSAGNIFWYPRIRPCNIIIIIHIRHFV